MCGICVRGDRKSPAAFALCRKSCNLMKRNLLKSQLGPVPCCKSPMDSPLSQLQSWEIQVWDMCEQRPRAGSPHVGRLISRNCSRDGGTNRGWGSGRARAMRLRQPQCIINLAASAHAYILISVYACEFACVCVCICGSICMWMCEQSRWGFLCSFNYSIIINDITYCQCG